MNTIKALEIKFPYQFKGKNIGIDIALGWSAIFEQLCSDIDILLGEDKQGFHWTQVKEKFGSGRAYWALGKKDGPIHIDIIGTNQVTSIISNSSKSELTESISLLVNTAMDKTYSTCAVCGEPGKVDQTGGYLLVLCPKHIAQRKKDPKTMDSPWPAD